MRRGEVRNQGGSGFDTLQRIVEWTILAVEAAFAVVGTNQSLSGEYWASRNRMSAIIGSSLVLSGIPVHLFWRFRR